MNIRFVVVVFFFLGEIPMYLWQVWNSLCRPSQTPKFRNPISQALGLQAYITTITSLPATLDKPNLLLRLSVLVLH